jgi:hypothetical protein
MFMDVIGCDRPPICATLTPGKETGVIGCEALIMMCTWLVYSAQGRIFNNMLYSKHANV